MKRILIKLLICLLIFLILFNFTYSNSAYAISFEDVMGGITGLIGGIVGLFLWPFRLIAIAVGTGIQLLTGTVATLMGGINAESGGIVDQVVATIDGMFITPFDIFFNRLGITSVNFFDIEGAGNKAVATLRGAVAGWYYIIRLIAISILLVILIYIGIRMALSTIASEKAVYKKMLVDWITSLALVFVLHYIIIFVIQLNEAIVNVLSGVADDSVGGAFVDVTLQLVWEGLLPLSGTAGIAATAVYILIIWQTFAFLIAYIKRMLTIGFLIIISPLITITYSIDRIGDGKSQALDSWLKEFVYNILLQPFHCILYLVFVDIAIKLVVGNPEDLILNSLSFGLSSSISNGTLGAAILAIMCMKFVWDGEKIVRKIFGFDKAGSLASAAASAAVAASAVGKLGNAAKGAATTVRKGMNFFKGDSQLATALKKDFAKRDQKRFDKKFEKGKIKDGDGNRIEGTKENREKAKEAWKAKKEGSFIGQYAKNHEEKRKKKEEDKSIVETGKKLDGTEASEEEKKEAKRRHEGSRAKRVISGIKSSETFKYYADPKRMGIAVGAVAGLGMYSGGSGGVLQAIAGAKAGAAFGEEFLKTSTKNQQTNIENQLQTQANITGKDIDVETELVNIQAQGENKQFDEKSITEKLKEFVNQIQGIVGGWQNANGIAGNIQGQLLKNPENFDLEKAFKDNVNLDSLSDKDKADLTSSSNKFASYINQSNIYQSILTGKATGLGVSNLAKGMGSISPEEVTVKGKLDRSDIDADLDNLEERASEATRKAQGEVDDLDDSVRKTGRNIDDLNDRTSENHSPIRPKYDGDRNDE